MPIVSVRLKSMGNSLQEIECSPQEEAILDVLGEKPESVREIFAKMPKGTIEVATIGAVIAKLRTKKLVQTIHRKIVKKGRTDRMAYHSITFTRDY